MSADIEREEAKKKEQRTRFAEDIKEQIKEKAKENDDDDHKSSEQSEVEAEAPLRSKRQYQRETNELANRLKNWDWQEVPELGVCILLINCLFLCYNLLISSIFPRIFGDGEPNGIKSSAAAFKFFPPFEGVSRIDYPFCMFSTIELYIVIIMSCF